MSNSSNPIFKQLALAISFITRIPVPYRWCEGGDVGIASRWFSSVGLLIGAWSAMWLIVLTPVIGQPLAAIMAVIATIVITGGLHQDGLADLCDGFWGGWQKQRKLEIMKDSQIGSYGVLALIASFSLSVTAISQLPLEWALMALLLAHSGSRAIAGLVPRLLTYARVEGPSKTPQAGHNIDGVHLLILLAPAMILLLMQPLSLALLLVGGWALLLLAMVALMRKHIDGYTGDTLGATQQVVEIGTLLLLIGYLGS